MVRLIECKLAIEYADSLFLANSLVAVSQETTDDCIFHVVVELWDDLFSFCYLCWLHGRMLNVEGGMTSKVVVEQMRR